MSKSLTDLHQLDALLADPLAPARAKKEAGTMVFGVLGAAAPREVIEAAGGFGVRLRGGPQGATPRADRFMEPVHEMWLRQVFDTLLSGEFDLLDAIVVPRSSEGLLQFYYLVEYVRSVEPDLKLPPLILFDLLQTPGKLTEDYVHQRVLGLAETFGTITGKPVTAEALSTQIAHANGARAAFRAATRLPGATGAQRLRLAAAGQLLDAADFRLLCETAGDAWHGDIPARPGIFVSGAGHESPMIYDVIAAAGIDVIGEDHDWGERLYAHDIATEADPFRAVARHYQIHGITPRQFEPGPPADDQTGTDAPAGALFCFDEHDDTFGWDYPAHRSRLAAAGLAVGVVRTRSGAFATNADAETLSRFLNTVTSGGSQ
ncbi:2-hydroxyacyl-CoA dehydratase family protein [Mariluticola halotolerans]|uniref:2-hydroxyacyl-CoA dehydratase family protein n=1 Tax=Mariluticola halotolerans TaxID=2909283 RepID=UPI0026E16E1A|nr:2-hydroxyacyl-CoA dehydratase family protein [Mariluticola halotolerans]UJQ93359.1 2-hydroxyacyl-CoA dehydratase family protein [Mariluticola halotolerans]